MDCYQDSATGTAGDTSCAEKEFATLKNLFYGQFTTEYVE